MDVLIRHARLIIFLLMVGSPLPANAGDLELREHEIKAGLLYNFLKYTQWPASSFSDPSSITVCVFGKDSFNESLHPMQERTVNQRQIILRELRQENEVEGCHLLFVNASEKKRWPQLLQSLAGKSVLTVSDAASFAASGGMIEFGHTANHISATLNVDAVNAAGLHIEDRLLKLVTAMQPARTGP